jgi:phosphoserine phosphatase RsbU/P
MSLLVRIERPLVEPVQHLAEGDALILGRSSKADLVIPDPFLSRLHARFYKEAGQWFVEDLGGRNRTVLNGHPLTKAERVSEGDVVTMSDTQIHVQSLRGLPPAAVEPPRNDATLFRAASALVKQHETDPGQGSLEERLQRATDRLKVLNEFHRALARPIELAALLELVLDRAFTDLRPEEAVVMLKDADGEYQRVASRRRPGVTGDFLYSRSLLREVGEKGMAALVSDASSDARFSTAQSILTSGVRSIVAAPLMDADGCLGIFVLSSRAHVRSFSEDDMEELAFLGAAAALRIRNLALMEESAQRRLYEKELALARRIQVALLPEHLPQIPGFELFAYNAPTRSVSGDLYQVQMRREDAECVLLLADVSGKGISASLLTASLEALSAGPIEVGLAADEICTRLSRRLYARTGGDRYATGFVAVLHTATGRLCWTNAGHNPAVIIRSSGETIQLPATGLPMGLLPIGDYTRGEHVLEPGDLLVAYTDGITEAANSNGDEYGLDRLVELCRARMTEGVEATSDALGRDVAAFAGGVPYGDDRTYVMLRRLPAPGS